MFRVARITTTAAVAVLLVVTSGLAATAAPSAPAVTGLSATPTGPRQVELSWASYDGFSVDHYAVTMEPGTRYQAVPAGTTSTLFEDLTWGANYTATVVAVSTSSPAVESTPAQPPAPGCQLSVRLDPSVVLRGSSLKLSGTLRRNDNSPIAGATIRIERDPYPFDSSGYGAIGTAVTDSQGAFTFPVRAKRNARFRALYSAPDTIGSWNTDLDLNVRVPVSLRFSTNPATFGQEVVFRGRLSAPRALVAGSSATLKRRAGDSWRKVASSTVKANGRYAISFTPRTRADLFWRVVTDAGPAFATSTSPPSRLPVS